MCYWVEFSEPHQCLASCYLSSRKKDFHEFNLAYLHTTLILGKSYFIICPALYYKYPSSTEQNYCLWRSLEVDKIRTLLSWFMTYLFPYDLEWIDDDDLGRATDWELSVFLCNDLDLLQSVFSWNDNRDLCGCLIMSHLVVLSSVHFLLGKEPK